VIVTDPVNASGFRLTGFEVIEATPKTIREEIFAQIAKTDVGILAVNEDLLKSLDTVMVRKLEGSDIPLVVPFPAFRSWEIPTVGEGYIAQLIRRAIGYHIKIARG
jgi:vacuolar-type H+-ATPase subunit F/Vma7